MYLCIILADHGIKLLSCLLSSSHMLFTLTVKDVMVINVLIKDNKEKQLIITSTEVRLWTDHSCSKFLEVQIGSSP